MLQFVKVSLLGAGWSRVEGGPRGIKEKDQHQDGRAVRASGTKPSGQCCAAAATVTIMIHLVIQQHLCVQGGLASWCRPTLKSRTLLKSMDLEEPTNTLKLHIQDFLCIFLGYGAFIRFSKKPKSQQRVRIKPGFPAALGLSLSAPLQLEW